MPKQGFRFLPPLVALCAATSAALILWSQRQAVQPRAVALRGTAPAISLAKEPERPVPSAAPLPVQPSAPKHPRSPSPAANANAGQPPAPVQAKSTPMPAPPAAPEAAQAKPQPEKAPNNKLQAPPPALDVPAIAAQPQLWPAQIVLLEPTEFPVFVGGKQAGSVRLPRGTSVMLRKVNTDGTVDVQREGATARIPAKCTNLSMAVKNDPPSGNGSASGPTAARPENTPVHLLDVSVSPDADTGADVDEQGTRLRSYRIKIVNATDQKYPKVLVRFFAFARTANDEVILAANDEQSCDIGPNTELTVLPAKLRVVKGRMLEGYAVLLRDAANNIVGSQTTIESVAKNWPALESLPPGAPLP